MQNYNWDLKTQFVFPEEYGIVEDVVSVDIKPRWQLIETEDSLRLVGIYHITSTLRFDPYELPEYSEGTLIEHLELNGNEGYFEYALPLEVNLPKEKIPTGSNPEISIEEIHYNVFDGSSATFNWDVCCTITEPMIEPVNNEEEIIQFESYMESSSIPLEIPSAYAFADLIQEPVAEKLESVEVYVEPVSLESEIEDNQEEITDELEINELENAEEHENTNYLEITDEPSDDESFSSYIEPETYIQSSNLINPEIEELSVDALQDDVQFEDLVQSENLIQQVKPVDRAFDSDDFFSDLSESYTILDIKSNKVSPE